MSIQDKSLDVILTELGDFGKYQVFVLFLVSLAVVLHSAVHVAFVFTAKDIQYRCEVPGCDIGLRPEYEPSWIRKAVPYEKEHPVKCFRFSTKNSSADCTDRFDANREEKCDKFVFKDRETTIVQAFGLFCEENVWKLTMVGTLNTVGQFLGLGVSGVLSDRYGRKVVLLMGLILCGLAGIARAFTTKYVWFLVLETLDATFSAGAYSCGFILGAELVGPQHRVLSGVIIGCCFTIGEILTAAVAYYTQDWRIIILILYSPLLLLISYFWLIPESVRWLLAEERYEEAANVLRKAAKTNGKTISEDTLAKLCTPQEKTTVQEIKYPISELFKSTILLMRFINSCFCWVTCAFLFYGFTLNSIALSGNSYLEFVLTALIEIPAYFATYLFLDRIGRKPSLCGSFMIAGIACFVFIVMPANWAWLKLCMYLSGKFGATAAFTIVYVVSSEIFPTPLRHTLMGVCSMFARIGSMVSPQMPLLAQIWTPFPLVLFGGMAVTAGLLTLLFPETLNVNLPDTIEEAENIGKENKGSYKVKNAAYGL